MNLQPLKKHDRVRWLKALHRACEDLIDEERSRPLPDSFRLQALKRMRLRLRDRMHVVTEGLAQHGRARSFDLA